MASRKAVVNGGKDPSQDRSKRMRDGYDRMRSAVAAAQTVDIPEDAVFRDPGQRPRLWAGFLLRLEDAEGKAIRLNVPKLPAGLKAAARKEGLRIEACERGDHILVRCTGLVPQQKK